VAPGRTGSETVLKFVACFLREINDVDCWIGVAHEADRCVVRVAGTLTHAQVPELLKACANCPTLVLDLQDLLNADVTGIDAIRRFRSAGATLVGTSGYIQLKLDAAVMSARGLA
jgi:hypothetical protein